MSKRYLLERKNGIGEVSIEEAFPFLREMGHVISLVGGGGKTTLLYLLAETYAKNGYHTLLTTTTHIQRPKEDLWVHSEKEVEENWKQGKIAIIGEESGTEKMMSPEEKLFHYSKNQADAVVIEADGAKRMSCKVPNATEPVILLETDIVIGVMGLEVIGKPLNEVCFRLQEAMELLSVPENHRVTEEDAVKILTSHNGTRKGVETRTFYVVLNKCDDENRLQIGKKMLQLLKAQGIDHIVLTKLI